LAMTEETPKKNVEKRPGLGINQPYSKQHRKSGGRRTKKSMGNGRPITWDIENTDCTDGKKGIKGKKCRR